MSGSDIKRVLEGYEDKRVPQVLYVRYRPDELLRPRTFRWRAVRNGWTITEGRTLGELVRRTRRFVASSNGRSRLPVNPVVNPMLADALRDAVSLLGELNEECAAQPCPPDCCCLGGCARDSQTRRLVSVIDRANLALASYAEEEQEDGSDQAGGHAA